VNTAPTKARVIVLAGPSGAGKSRLGHRLGLPVLRLDDFYHPVDHPELPRITSGANAGMVDWDHPGTWDHDAAMAAIRSLCATGSADVPVYDISTSSITGHRRLDLGDHTAFVAEGIFAPEVVAACRDEGVLLAAYCIAPSRARTFWRRLTRDLRERRKPPLVLVRRGWALMQDQPRVVAHAVGRGCRRATGDQAFHELRDLLAHDAVAH
jgi:uridine kinase